MHLRFNHHSEHYRADEKDEIFIPPSLCLRGDPREQPKEEQCCNSHWHPSHLFQPPKCWLQWYSITKTTVFQSWTVPAILINSFWYTDTWSEHIPSLSNTNNGIKSSWEPPEYSLHLLNVARRSAKGATEPSRCYTFWDRREKNRRSTASLLHQKSVS